MTITINDDFLSAEDALIAQGFEKISPCEYDPKHFFTKDGKDYKFISMNHFNTYIYKIELEELDQEDYDFYY